MADVDALIRDIRENAVFKRASGERNGIVGVGYYINKGGQWKLTRPTTQPLEWKKLFFIDKRTEVERWMVNQWTPANAVRAASYLLPQPNRKLMLPREATEILMAIAWPQYVIDPEAIVI